MNTPGHAILNLVLLDRPQRPENAWPIILGALASDLPIVVFYLWQKLFLGLSEHAIWYVNYFQSPFLPLFDGAHSLVLSGVAWFGSWRAGWRRASLFFASMFLHGIFDLPIHNDDAHRHFFPLSDFRFFSPLSYWDTKHHAGLVASLEVLLVFGLGIWLLRKRRSRETALRVFLVVSLAAYGASLATGIIFWDTG